MLAKYYFLFIIHVIKENISLLIYFIEYCNQKNVNVVRLIFTIIVEHV